MITRTICSSDASVLKLSQSESFCTPSLSEKSLRSSAVRSRAVGIHADIRQPLSVCCLDESGSVQNKTCFWHSRLPRTSLPTSPGLILIVFPLNIRKSWKKSHTSLWHFWIPPLHCAHTFLANGHSHSKCPTVSGCWQHISHRGSTCTRLLCRLAGI